MMGHFHYKYIFGVQEVNHVKFILTNMLPRRLVQNESDDLVLGNLQFVLDILLNPCTMRWQHN